MANLKLSLLLSLLLVSALYTPTLSLTSDLSFPSYYLSDSGSGSGSGSEQLFQSEFDEPTTRRFLGGGGYISYAALRRDSVPCSRRGASYYNCRPGAQANPYSRGCSRITRCRN